MTKEQATAAATKEAAKNNITMAVVKAPIENAEDTSGPYGYCPFAAVGILFKHAREIVPIRPPNHGAARPSKLPEICR